MRGVTVIVVVVPFVFCISTHTPHARRDAAKTYYLGKKYRFLLTRLMRGVTQEAA